MVGNHKLDAPARECCTLAAQAPGLLTEKRSVAPTVSSSMKLRFDRRSSSMLQSEAMRPFFRIRTSSQVSSMSRSRCDEISSRMLPLLANILDELNHALAGDGI